MQDLEYAIKHIQAAVNKKPSGHPDLPGRLNNLGSQLRHIVLYCSPVLNPMSYDGNCVIDIGCNQTHTSCSQ